METQVVSGRERRWPRVVKEALVSPRPCRRIKTFVAGCEAGGEVILRVIDEGKSLLVGNRHGMMQAEY